MTKTIQIERLKAPTIIHRVGGDFGPFGAFAEVQDVEFDGHSYIVTARLVEDDEATDWVGDTEVVFVVDAGGSVQFGGRDEPKLRGESDVSFEEWQAKAEAIGLDIDRGLVKLGELQDYQPRAIDERPLVAAVAEAIGVPTLIAEVA